MLNLLRRFVIVAAFAFWQGGFTFYSSVVVPIGGQVLGSPKEQGFITRKVTVYLNLAGGIALLLFAWDIAAAKDPWAWRYRLRWFSWLGMAATLIALIVLHRQMNEMLDPVTWGIHNRPDFYLNHRWYLWINTVQWGFGVIFLLLTLWVWQTKEPPRGTLPG